MKIGFTCSTFDLLHAGHIMMLKEAKSICEHLIVGLQTDPSIDRDWKNKPVQTLFERFTQLQACKYVDEILIYETEYDLLQLLQTQTIHIRFLSEEYLNRDFTGKQWCMNNGIELHYHKRQHDYSSSELRARTAKLENAKDKDSSKALPQYSPELIKAPE